MNTKGYLDIIGKIVAIIALIAFTLWVNTLNIEGSVIESYAERFGYIGLFVVSVISGFNVFVPIPVAAFYPFLLTVGFHPIITVAVISAGMVMGDLIGYSIGRTGRSMLKEEHVHTMQKMLHRLDALAEKHRALPLVFLFVFAAFVPLPNELVVIPMGFLRFRLWMIMLTAFLGNLLFNTLIALGFIHIPGLLF